MYVLLVLLLITVLVCESDQYGLSLSQIAVDGAANASVTTQKLDLKFEEETVLEQSLPTPKAETISSIMADVTNLVKYVIFFICIMICINRIL